MDYSNKEIFGDIYTGQQPIYNKNGVAINIQGKSDDEISKIIQQNLFNLAYTGPELKPGIKEQIEEAPTRVEKSQIATQKKESESLMRMQTTLQAAGVGQADIDLMIPNPQLNNVESPLYNPEKYNQQLNNYQKLDALNTAGTTNEIPDLFKTIQKGLTYPIRNYPGFQEAYEKLDEVVPEPIFKLGGNIRDFFETYTPIGTRTTAENMAANFDAYDLPSELEGYGSDVYSKLLDPKAEFKPYEDFDPGYTQKSILTPVRQITQLTIENAAIGAPMVKSMMSLSTKWGQEFTEFMGKKLANDGIEEVSEEVLKTYFKNPSSLLDEFFVQQKGYKKGTIFHKMFLEPRLKTGLSIEQSRKNAKLLDDVSLKIQKNTRLRNEAIADGKPKSIIDDLERQITVDRQTQFNLFVESAPRYVRTELQAGGGAVLMGTYFSQSGLFGGQAMGEISGSVLFPSAAGVVTGTVKKVNNLAADLGDIYYNAFQIEPGTANIFSIFGAKGTTKKSDQLLLMRDPKADGNERLNIPKGFRQATEREQKAYETLFLGLSKNLNPESRDEVLRIIQESNDEYRKVEQFLMKNGMSETDAYDIASRAMSLSLQIPAIQHLTLENTLKLRPSDYLGFNEAVAKHTDMYIQSQALQQQLLNLLEELSPIKKGIRDSDNSLNTLFNALTQSQANNKKFLIDMESQIERSIDVQLKSLVGTNEHLGDPDEIILNLDKIRNLKDEYPDVQFKDFKQIIDTTEQKINLLNTFEKNAQVKMDNILKLMDSPEQQVKALNQSKDFMLRYIKTKKALLSRHWERNFKTPLNQKLQNENIVDFSPILKQLEDSFPDLQYDGIVKKTGGTEQLIGLLPKQKQMFALYKSLERPALEALQSSPIFKGFTATQILEETAQRMGKDPDKVSFFEVWKFYNGKSVKTPGADVSVDSTLNLPLNLNFEESHNIKKYFNNIINSELASTKETNIAPIFIDVRDNVTDSIDTFFSNSSDEIKTLYSNYNNFYRVNIGEVYTRKKGYDPLGAYATPVRLISSKNVPVFLKGYPDNFYSLTALNKEDNTEYVQKLAQLYGVDVSSVGGNIPKDSLYNGRIFVELSEEEIKNAPVEVALAARGYQQLKNRLEIEFRAKILPNTPIGKKLLALDSKDMTPELRDEIQKLTLDSGAFQKLLKETNINTSVFVRQSDGTVVFKPLVDVNAILRESKLDLEHLYRSYPNIRKDIDKITTQQKNDILKVKGQIKTTFNKEMAETQTFISAYERKFGQPISVKDFYNRYISNPAMLGELEKELVEGGFKVGGKEQVLTKESFDTIMKDLIYAGLMDEVGAGTTVKARQLEKLTFGMIKEKITNKILNPFKSAPPSRITRSDDEKFINLAVLKKRLTEDEDLFRTIIPEEEFETLVSLTSILIKESGGKGGPAATLEGLARGLSVPSLQSRIYNVIRGIISPTYVFGEASFLQFRKSKQAFITEILTNREASNNLLKILNSEKPLKEEEYRKAFGVIYNDVMLPILAKHLLLEDEEGQSNIENITEQMGDLLNEQ